MTTPIAGRFYSQGCKLVRKALVDRGWSERELGRRLDLDSGRVSRLIRGERKPRRALQLRIRSLLRIPLSAWAAFIEAKAA